MSTLILISACQFNTSQYQKKIDSDNDGIIDSNDDCPDIFGLEEFDGCPDTDEDGVIDSEDDCPEEPGLEEYNGCPDSDGDGISDPNDQCPDEFGFERYNGCPDFGSQTQNLTVQSCLEIITLNNDEKNEALKFLEKDDIVMCQLNDAVLERSRDEQLDLERELPGKTGLIDTAPLLNFLNNIGYEGTVSAEPFNKELNKMNNEDAAKTTYNAIKSSFENAGIF